VQYRRRAIPSPDSASTTSASHGREVDRRCKIGFSPPCFARIHRADPETVEHLTFQAQADESLSVPRHEIHQARINHLRGNYEIAFILAVHVIGNHYGPAVPKCFQCRQHSLTLHWESLFTLEIAVRAPSNSGQSPRCRSRKFGSQKAMPAERNFAVSAIC
jgi:hypothetical protein